MSWRDEPACTLQLMDAGLAAIIGAGVGAVASIGATAISAIPGLSAEDRAHRVARRAQLLEVVTEITEHLAEVTTSPGTTEATNKRRVRLYVLRIQLAALLPKRDQIILDLFDTARASLGRGDNELSDSAVSLFSLAAGDAGRRTLDRAKLRSRHNLLRSKLDSLPAGAASHS